MMKKIISNFFSISLVLVVLLVFKTKPAYAMTKSVKVPHSIESVAFFYSGISIIAKKQKIRYSFSKTNEIRLSFSSGLKNDFQYVIKNKQLNIVFYSTAFEVEIPEKFRQNLKTSPPDFFVNIEKSKNNLVDLKIDNSFFDDLTSKKKIFDKKIFNFIKSDKIKYDPKGLKQKNHLKSNFLIKTSKDRYRESLKSPEEFLNEGLSGLGLSLADIAEDSLWRKFLDRNILNGNRLIRFEESLNLLVKLKAVAKLIEKAKQHDSAQFHKRIEELTRKELDLDRLFEEFQTDHLTADDYITLVSIYSKLPLISSGPELEQNEKLFLKSIKRQELVNALVDALVSTSIEVGLSFLEAIFPFYPHIRDHLIESLLTRFENGQVELDLIEFYKKIPSDLDLFKRDFLDRAQRSSYPFDTAPIADNMAVLARIKSWNQLVSWSNDFCEIVVNYPLDLVKKVIARNGNRSLVNSTNLVLKSDFRLSEVQTIEYVRKKLNQCSNSNFGDKLSFELLAQYSSIEIVYDNFEKVIQFINEVVGYSSSLPRDVGSMYQIFVRYLANNVANYIKNDEDYLVENLSDDILSSSLNTLNSLGINVQLKTSDLSKLWMNLKQGNISYITNKAISKLGERSGKLEDSACHKHYQLSPPYDLKGGFKLSYLSTNGKLMASFVQSGSKQSKINYEVGVGGKVTSSYLRNTYGVDLVGSTVASYSVAKKPSQLAIIDGDIQNWFIALNQKALVLINNRTGKLRVVNVEQFEIEENGNLLRLEILKNFNHFNYFLDWVKRNQFDVFQSHLLAFDEKNRVTEDWQQIQDKRRVLVELHEGEFGIVDFEDYISLNEAACLALKFPGVRSVVNLDTGMYDIATFEDPNGNLVEFGTPDKEKKDHATNKLVFFRDPK